MNFNVRFLAHFIFSCNRQKTLTQEKDMRCLLPLEQSSKEREREIEKGERETGSDTEKKDSCRVECVQILVAKVAQLL